MLGYDMGWASFHVVEVMSSPRLHLKSVGYLAATQSFEQDTDVLMLTTNLLKKASHRVVHTCFELYRSART
jgi:AP-3 complex subunit delta